MAHVARAHVFDERTNVFDRPPGHASEKRQRGTFDSQTLGAELTADVTRLNDDLAIVDLEHLRDGVAQFERALVTRNDVEHAGAVEPDQRRAGLEISGMIPRRGEGALEDAIGRSEDRVRIALHVELVTLHVRVRQRRTRRPRVLERRDVRVRERRIGLDGRQRIQLRRQFLVGNVEQRCTFDGRFARLGPDNGDELADERDLAVREYRPIIYQVTETAFADVLTREHRVYPRHRQRRCFIDRDDLGMRVRGLGEGRPEHALAGYVGGIDRLSADFDLTVDARFVAGEEGACRLAGIGSRRR